jgi:GTP-binding protein LepA
MNHNFENLQELLATYPELLGQIQTFWQEVRFGKLTENEALELSQMQVLEFLENLEKNKETKYDLAIFSPSALPDPSQIKAIMEPWAKLEIITPEEYVGKIIELVTQKRGNYDGISLLSLGQMQLTARIPLAEMIVDFYDDLKSLSKGYATMSYEITGFEAGSLVKIDILVNGKVVDPLSIITHKDNAENKGRHICEKLKELIPRQQIDIALQAAIGSRIIARETIKCFRKDVTAKLYGGDISRRMKLLDKQKAGKKRMKMVGNVEIPQSAFLNVLKK